MRVYLNKNVLEAAKERIKYIFDEFEDKKIIVSISGGKDSTVIYHLSLQEAIQRNRKIHVFFLDQEVEYESTIVLVRKLMKHPNVIPLWYQVPIYMTNTTSYFEDQLYAWGEGQQWMREKEPNSIHSLDEDYPKRFYPFFKYLEGKYSDSAFIIGLRSDESLNRYRTVTRNPGYKDIKWSTKTKNPTTFRFYPIYDWGHGDVWKYIDENHLEYNRVYDLMFTGNHSIYSSMRVSNLIHEKSFKCLTELQQLEPETYNKLVKRLQGVHAAARYANEDMIYSANRLPGNFKTWKEYRDYLLENYPGKHKERFLKRFEQQGNEEFIYQQQCKQLLMNDWENEFGVNARKKQLSKKTAEKWKKML